MEKPLLIVVTGRPASGKTTLAHLLSREIKCPLLSRDEFKEGYINTSGMPHTQLTEEANRDIYEIFFQAIDLLISKGITLVVEAAFQHKLWAPKLINLSDKAAIKIIVCKIPLEAAKERFYKRLIEQPDREKFHGDASNKESVLLTGDYQTLKISAPTLEVDTSDYYKPDLKKIVDFIRRGT
jgi:predicted kinase